MGAHSGPFRSDRPTLVGMVHLQALPGSPKFGGDWQAVLTAARRDAAALAEGGADAIMVENFNDAPFFKCAAPRITVATMTAAAACVKEAAGRLPVGVNVLRNDGRAALAVALAVGCDFIRVNVLCGARATDQGIIEGIAARLLRERHWLGAEHVAIWADVDVKHSAPLGPGRSLEDEVADLLERGGAEALIVSGAGTGKPADPAQLARVKAASAGHPVLVGSGATLEDLHSLRPHCDGLIVGTALKSGNAVDIQRVRSLAEALDSAADPTFAPDPAAR